MEEESGDSQKDRSNDGIARPCETANVDGEPDRDSQEEDQKAPQIIE